MDPWQITAIVALLFLLATLIILAVSENRHRLCIQANETV